MLFGCTKNGDNVYHFKDRIFPVKVAGLLLIWGLKCLLTHVPQSEITAPKVWYLPALDVNPMEW